MCACRTRATGVAPASRIALVRFDVDKGEPARGPDGFCIRSGRGEAAEAIIAREGYQMLSDRDAIATAVAAAIAANPQAIDELKKGKKKPEAVKGFLRGQVMKQTCGKANPALVGELLEQKLAEMLV